MKPACTNCIFWDYLHEHNAVPIGRCVALPPRPHPQEGAAWPITERYDWCGRFTGKDKDPATLLDALP